MKDARSPVVLLVLLALPALLLLPAMPAEAWGRDAHDTIARSACLALPDDMRPFFMASRAWLGYHAQDPDLWREKDPAERNRHYMDIDKLTAEEVARLDPSLAESYRRLGRKKLDDVGVVPWRVAEFTGLLTDALRRGNWTEVRRTAAALSHYIADSCVPFHATKNYNGKATGNLGIHGRFDIELVNRFLVGPYLAVRPARRVENVFDFALRTIKDSNGLVPACLKADDAARKTAPLDTEEYYLALFRGCGEIARRRMVLSAQASADLWYTAWLAAGKPDLPPKQAVIVIMSGMHGLWSRRVEKALECAALAGPLDQYDAIAFRLTEAKSVWARGVRFTAVADLGAEVPLVMKKQAAFPVTPGRARAYERLHALTHTPSLAVGLPEAVAALSAYPKARRRIVLVCDGTANEKYLNVAEAGRSILKAGIALECYAVGKTGRKDARLRQLVKAAAGTLTEVADWHQFRAPVTDRKGR